MHAFWFSVLTSCLSYKILFTFLFSAHPSMASLPSPSPEVAGAAVAGALTFPAVLAGSQVALFKPLGLTYTQGSRSSSLLGGLAVCVAGFTASIVTAETLTLLQSSLPKSNGQTSKLGPVTATDLLLSSLSSVVVFRALGGRFGSVLPSHLLCPGAFAREWLPTSRGMQYANEKEREMIQSLGKRHGCHSCGRRRVSSFVSDHQPPTKLVTESETGMLSQRLYPQCNSCSQQQGGVLRGNGKYSPKAIRTHVSSLRPHHIFVPLPLLFAYLYRGEKERVEVPVVKEAPKEEAVQTVPVQQDPPKHTLHKLLHESNINELVLNFPLLIIWQKLVNFLDSFRNAGDSFHLTLWSFLIIAALGTI